jgi:hypothetical protein
MWDTDTLSDERVLAAGPAGFAVFFEAVNWSRAHLTDGHIPAHVWETLGRLAGASKASAGARRGALASNLVVTCEETGGYYIPGYEGHQQTRSEVEKSREKNRVKQENYRTKRRSSNPVSNPVTTPVTEDPVTRLVTGQELKERREKGVNPLTGLSLSTSAENGNDQDHTTTPALQGLPELHPSGSAGPDPNQPPDLEARDAALAALHAIAKRKALA